MRNEKIIKSSFNIIKKSTMMMVVMLGMLAITGCRDNHSFVMTNSAGENVEIESREEQQNEPQAESQGESQNEPREEPQSESAGGNIDTTDTVTLVMVGDVLLHTPINESALQEDGSYDFRHLFAHVKDDIQAADIALVNQEVILGGTELGLSGYPAFNGAFEAGDALVDTGFDVVLHATNHALDKGRQGILNCLNYWHTKQPQMKVVGIYDSAAAQESQLCICEQNGIKVAVLNYTYGTNGIPLPAGMQYAVNLLDEDQVERDVEHAKEEADFVVVCPHWGQEYSHGINGQQEKYAQLFADLGVDLVIGTHPHVIEPVEWVEGENGQKTLVYYSLGNFINATSGSGEGVADRMVGAMAEVTLKRDKTGQIVIEEYGVEPLVTQMLTGRNRITTYKLSDYSQKLADENEVLERDDTFSYDFCKELCHEVFGDLYP